MQHSKFGNQTVATLTFVADRTALELNANAASAETSEHRRVKRSYPACPCESEIQTATGGITWSDLFLYTNGRCYAQWAFLRNYTDSQYRCQIGNPGVGNVGRLANFDNGSDYVAITSAMTGYTPTGGAKRAFIGIYDQQFTDPNTPSCPAQLNVAQFEASAGVIIPPTNYVAVGGWSTWTSVTTAVTLDSHICEFGKPALKS